MSQATPTLTTDERSRQRFEKLQQLDDFPPQQIRNKVLILSMPRTGSNLFGDVMQQTGHFGLPLEWFNPRFLEIYQQMQGQSSLNLDQYIDFLLRKTTRNGVFTVKLHIDQWHWLNGQNIDVFALGFDVIYMISRRNKIDQAYSNAKALKYDHWNAVEKPGKPEAGELLRSDVMRALYLISLWDEWYQQFLRPRVQREFVYEDFAQIAHTEVFDLVCKDLGIEPLPNWQTSMTRQRQTYDEYRIADLKHYLDPLRR